MSLSSVGPCSRPCVGYWQLSALVVHCYVSYWQLSALALVCVNVKCRSLWCTVVVVIGSCLPLHWFVLLSSVGPCGALLW